MLRTSPRSSSLLLRVTAHCYSLSYGDNKSLVKSVCSSLEVNHPSVLPPGRTASSDEQKLLVICAMLSKAFNSEGLLSESLLTENVTECIILLLYCELVHGDSAAMLLNELVKVSPYSNHMYTQVFQAILLPQQCPPLLPLVLLKVSSVEL